MASYGSIVDVEMQRDRLGGSSRGQHEPVVVPGGLVCWHLYSQSNLPGGPRVNDVQSLRGERHCCDGEADAVGGDQVRHVEVDGGR
jgi:hypothetical protein